jgi:RND family efflux transporter MFP subunit
MNHDSILRQILPLFLILLLTTGGCSDEPESVSTDPPGGPRMVTTTSAELVEVRNQLELMGTIVPERQAEIAAKVSGTIVEMEVVLGSLVQKGDLLAVLSAGEIDAKLRQSAAQLEQARRNLEREKKLLSRNAATSESVRSYREALDIATAAYQEAKTIEGYTRILAPISGKVTRKDLNIGDLATPGKPLLKIEDNTELQVYTDIPENHILDVELGETFNVVIPSAGISIPGIVAEKALTADPATRSAPVKLSIQSNPKLFGGQFARVALDPGTSQTLVVPRASIHRFGQMERVFVVEGDRARLRLVQSGTVYGDKIEILAGLAAGDIVVTGGIEGLTDNQPVTISR